MGRVGREKERRCERGYERGEWREGNIWEDWEDSRTGLEGPEGLGEPEHMKRTGTDWKNKFGNDENS